MNKIIYKIGAIPKTEEICTVYESSGINRPTGDKNRIAEMYQNSDLIVSAWDGDKLVGVSRSITDFVYVCYLSDLAIRKEYQKLGIGKELIDLTKKALGDKVAIVLLAAPSAVEYYPKVGFESMNATFIMKRKI
jgi:predicted N-acetyltransferase YhbS